MGKTESKSLNVVISDAVRYLMKSHAPKALSQGGLARLSGVAQATICMNLKGERGWSIDILEKLCPPLGVELEDLICIGKELQVSNNVFPWPAKLRGSASHSNERLRLIIAAAAGGSTQLAKLVNPQSVKETSPEEYEGYLSGKLSDGDIYAVLRKNLGYVESQTVWISKSDEEGVDVFYS